METVNDLRGEPIEVMIVVREIDESKMKDCRKKRGSNRLQTLMDNMISVLEVDIDEEKFKKAQDTGDFEFGMSIADYAMTEEALAEFYSHPYNKSVITKLKKERGLGWFIFQLNHEPRIINEEGDSV